ncbi:MAG: heavy-metal-associated domain-containing protein [Kiritimatiellales bacterium]
MKTLLKKLTLLAALLLLAGCLRNDIRTETFQIKQLRTQAGAARIALALKQVAGIKDVRPDLEKHTLTVVFDGLECYLKNIEYAIVKAGFDLPNWPADAADKAKLPEELR